MKYIVCILFLNFLNIEAAIAEQGLKRLFFSVEERAQIELGKTDKTKSKSKVNKSTHQTSYDIELKGYVKRKGQPDVVWINTVNTLKSNKPLSGIKVLKVQNNGKVALKLEGKGLVRLKPGQVISRNKKTVKDIYEK